MQYGLPHPTDILLALMLALPDVHTRNDLKPALLHLQLVVLLP